MNIFTFRGVYLFLLFAMASACTAEVQPESLHVSRGKYSDYYHLEYKLDKQSFSFGNDDNGKSYARYTDADITNNGGQFEILIPVSDFPVAAPNCQSSIIVRMPWTGKDSENGQTAIAEKLALFKKIRQLYKGKGKPVKIILELNPYVRAFNKSPLKLELTQCNVFFRHAGGRYIDHIGAMPCPVRTYTTRNNQARISVLAWRCANPTIAISTAKLQITTLSPGLSTRLAKSMRAPALINLERKHNRHLKITLHPHQIFPTGESDSLTGYNHSVP